MSVPVQLRFHPGQFREIKELADRLKIPVSKLCVRLILNGKAFPDLCEVVEQRAVPLVVVKQPRAKPIKVAIEAERESAIELFARGWTINQIAARLKRPYATVAKEIGALADEEARHALM